MPTLAGNAPLMIHITDSPIPWPDILAEMKRGDHRQGGFPTQLTLKDATSGQTTRALL